MTRLRFVGPEGHFTPGIPAEDFETEDEALVEAAVESGLHVIEGTPAPKPAKAAVAPQPAPTDVSGDPAKESDSNG